jgi:hypothetical protein
VVAAAARLRWGLQGRMDDAVENPFAITFGDRFPAAETY